MTRVVAVCLGVVVLWATPVGAVRPAEAFDLANRVGEPTARCFYLFSTSVGNYAIRQDGMGEVSSAKGMRRVFRLKVGAKGHIDRVYFLEHEGDLFLLYEVRDASSDSAFLVRMEQKKRKFKWSTTVTNREAPVAEGEALIVGGTKISKADGKILATDEHR